MKSSHRILLSPSTPHKGAAITSSSSAFTSWSNRDVLFQPSSMIKLISWNVNGLRSFQKKRCFPNGKLVPPALSSGLSDPSNLVLNPLEWLVDSQQPDILCLQETKLSDLKEAATIGVLPGYVFVDSVSTAKKGYSGTRTYVKNELAPFIKHHCFALDASKVPEEHGRIITTQLIPPPAAAAARSSPSSSLRLSAPLTIVNTYVQNSGMKLENLSKRVDQFDVQMRAHLSRQLAASSTLSGNKATTNRTSVNSNNVVWLGDLNVAVEDTDVYESTNTKRFAKYAGFTPEERASFRKTLADLNMVDSFRHLYPNARGAYTFFSAKFNARALGNGWRLDYAVVSQSLVDRVVDSFMLPEVEGSDHSPVVLWLKR